MNASHIINFISLLTKHGQILRSQCTFILLKISNIFNGQKSSNVYKPKCKLIIFYKAPSLDNANLKKSWRFSVSDIVISLGWKTYV